MSGDTRWSGQGFGFEPLRGLRWFRAEEDGALRSAFNRFTWAEGDNVADCLARSMAELAVQIHDAARSVRRADVDPPLPAAPDPHDMITCTCGFHALTADAANYRQHADYGNVVGVLEGYGEVVEGRKGFRASRGRIVALAVSPAAPGLMWRRAPRRYGRILAWGGLAVLLWWLANQAGELVGWSLATILAGYFGGKAVAEIMNRPWVDSRREFMPVPKAKLAARYPGIPIYDNVAEMLAAHPLTVPDPKAPALDAA